MNTPFPLRTAALIRTGSTIALLALCAVRLSCWASESDVVSPGIYQVTAKCSGKCLDATASGTANGTKVQQNTANGGANQQWQIDVQSAGYLRIVAPYCAKTVDISGVSTSDGAQVQLWSDNGQDNQRFAFLDAGGNWFKVVAKHSGKCLDVSGASTTDGAKVQQWTDNGTNAQRWRLNAVYALTAGNAVQAAVVALGDLVTVTSTVTGSERVYVGCGTSSTSSFPVTTGAKFIIPTTTAGVFTYRTYDPAGQETGALTVTVTSTDLADQSIADEIGFTRQVTVGVVPDNAPISFASSDPAALSVGAPIFSGHQATFTVKVLAAGPAHILGRIAGPRGTVTMSRCSVDSFTIATTATQTIPIIKAMPDGSHLDQAYLTLTPRIPNLTVSMRTIVSGVFFDDSTTSRTVSTNVFVLGLTEGTYIYNLLRLATGWPHTCHEFWVTQNGVAISKKN